MSEYYIGIDIGGTKCAVVLAQAGEEIRILRKIRFETRGGFDEVYSRFCSAIDEILTEAKERPRAIGISCGGPLDASRGIIQSPPNLPGWDDIPIVQMLESRYQIPAYLQNDANACALVEWLVGAGKGCKNMVFLTMGTGMGAGIIANGALLDGACGMAGEVGHIRLCADGPMGYGKAGSFEGFTSGGGMARWAREVTGRMLDAGMTPDWVKDGISMECLDAKTMACYAKKGNAAALRFFDEVGTKLGEGIAYLADILNPEKVVIGSIFARCEELLRPAMQRAILREALPATAQSLCVCPAKTGESIGDLAGIVTAIYSSGDSIRSECTEKSSVMAHFDRLFERYPALSECKNDIFQAYLILKKAFSEKNKLLIAGNGGSCSDSEHITGELMKGFLLKRPLSDELSRKMDAFSAYLPKEFAWKLQCGLPVIALTAQTALSTAIQNDLGGNLVFAQQIMGYGNKGDVFLGISTSGNSENIVSAACVAKAVGMRSIGLTGKCGGKLKELCDVCIRVPADQTADIQEYHLPVYHALCAMLESHFFEK